MARRRARPAVDEDRDPADVAAGSPPATAARTGTATRPAPARRGPEPTVQLNVRVSTEVRELVDQVVTETGRSLRDVVEHAIRASYGR